MNAEAVPDAPEFTPGQARSLRENIAFNTYQSRIAESFTAFREGTAVLWSRCRAERAAAEDDFVKALAELASDPSGRKAQP